jgi:hypothetical protein
LEPKSSSDSIASRFQCSADCLLEDWISRWDRWTAADSRLRRSLQPTALGRQLADLLVQRDRLAGMAATALASRFRERHAEPRPSPAGAALLARAGARERDTPMIDGVSCDAVSRIADNVVTSARR